MTYNDNIDKMNRYLKKVFFGIDSVIDEVSDKMKPWYHVPDSMMRPQIINLWGMTGTGKTALVRDIAKYLKMDIVQIDLGEFVGESCSNFGLNFYEKYYDFAGKPSIIFIDEFHIARTIDEGGGEIDRKGLRSLWHLLSDGIVYLNSSLGDGGKDNDEDKDELIDELDSMLKEYFRGKRILRKPKDDKMSEYHSMELEELAEKEKNPYKYFYSCYFKIFSRILGISQFDLKKKLNENFIGTMEWMKNYIEKNGGLQPKLDFSKSLIFISGNLDELYYNCDNFDPDIDLDIIKKNAESLTVSDVKQLLVGRFRLEQIGRLGNTHIIYPVLGKDIYEKIIKKDFNRIKKFYSKKMGINLSFDKTVVDIIYKEGVYPAQGARSVLSTIGSCLESVIVKFYMIYVESNYDDKKITVKYDDTESKFIFDIGKEKIVIEFSSKLEELRKPSLNDRSVVSAIHEAGHVLASIACIGVVPNRASVFSTTNNHDGIVEILMVDNIREEVINLHDMKRNIICSLSGYAAEKTFFGKELVTGGSSKDIEDATVIATEMVDKMGYVAGDISRKTIDIGDKTFVRRTMDDDGIIKSVLEESFSTSEELIKDNMEFVKSVADKMISKYSIDKKDIKEVMEKHGLTVRKKDDYVKIFNEFSKRSKN